MKIEPMADAGMPVGRLLGTVWLACCLALSGGCAVVSAPGDVGPALARFEPATTDPRVRGEPGAQALAERVAALLPGAIAQVEQRHRRRFAAPVRVHVCASSECFARLVPRPPGMTAAVAFDNRLILAPRLFDREPHRLRPILVHELSHLHLGQRLGHYTPSIPVWFHEGLASWVADGGGADLATEAQARAAFIRRPAPTFIEAERAPGPAGLRVASDSAPDPVAYRQWFWFVDWLARTRPGNFAWMLDSIQDGHPFHTAFGQAFAEGLAGAFDAFIAGARAGAPR